MCQHKLLYFERRWYIKAVVSNSANSNSRWWYNDEEEALCATCGEQEWLHANVHISSIDGLISNSMNILEPVPLDANGNEQEDVMQARKPVDLSLLPRLENGFLIIVFLLKWINIFEMLHWWLQKKINWCQIALNSWNFRNVLVLLNKFTFFSQIGRKKNIFTQNLEV